MPDISVGSQIRGLIADFKPCAYYISGMKVVVVARKDCSYTAVRVNEWLDLHYENHRPWFAPWKKCVGFSVYCPFREFNGKPAVSLILERILRENSKALAGQEKKLFKLAGDLMVVIPARER